MVLNLIFPILPPQKSTCFWRRILWQWDLTDPWFVRQNSLWRDLRLCWMPCRQHRLQQDIAGPFGNNMAIKDQQKGYLQGIETQLDPSNPSLIPQLQWSCDILYPLIFTGNPLELHVDRSSVWLENVAKPVCDLNCPDPSDVPFGFIYIMPDGYMKDAATWRIHNSQQSKLKTLYTIDTSLGRGWWWLWLMLMWLMWLMWLMIVVGCVVLPLTLTCV